MKKSYILTSLLLFAFMASAWAQTTTLTGSIKDAADNSIIYGASVTIKDGFNGSATDAAGNFSLKVKSLPITLKFSAIGYAAQEIVVKDASPIAVLMKEDIGTLAEVKVSGNRVEESITKSAVSIEKIGVRQIQQQAAFDIYASLQNLKGVDLLSQNMIFRSVNMRGFGANNNNRFVQLSDGMDNRSPGLGFGFGNVAGISDIDVESIEILPGASSALYGPDALQGIMLTKTKSPFEFQGLSAQVKLGVNNVGKADYSPKPYTDLAVRYAKSFNDRVAFKVNFQAINGTDFVADDYSDRMSRSRAGFFVTDQAAKTVSIGYTPNNDQSTNLQFDALNIYGDDFTNGGAFTFPATAANKALAGKLVTRTGYKEIDLTGDNGKIYSYRGNAALHVKLTDKIEAIAAYYYGTGNLIRTAGLREYFPKYERHQARLEVKGDEFFVRAYNTSQTAEGFSLGNLAARMLQLWKPTAAWATDFSNAYTGDAVAARNAADAGKPAVGSAAFKTAFDVLTTTNSNVKSSLGGLNGVGLKDNSGMYHAEGMYNFKKILPANFEVITGASFRHYDLVTEGTVFPKDKNGKEFTINEYGWYLQASPIMKLAEKVSLKPTVAVRYDKNQYFKGGFTPRVSGVLSLGDHNFRASWQSAFRNPSPNQLLSDGVASSEVGGSRTAVESANLIANPGYYEASVLKYRTTGNAADLVKFDANPDNFTTEKIQSWEIGYKTLIQNRLFVDAFYYNSKYNDFIAAQNVLQSTTVGSQDALKNAATTKTYQVNFNNFNEIFVTGYGLGLEYALGKGYNVGFNYAKQIGDITLKDNLGVTRKDGFGAEIVKRRMSAPEVAAVGRNFFISPEDRFNVSFSNPKLTSKIGFNATFRWTGKMWVEQGNTQGDIWLPSWNTTDLAFTYKVPKIKTMFKVGGSNIFNQYYQQGYGLARVGGLYYIAINFDEMLK
jgi:iron complex outermembrane recepter protein